MTSEKKQVTADNPNPTHDLSSQKMFYWNKDIIFAYSHSCFVKRIVKNPKLEIIVISFYNNKKLSIPFVCSSFDYCYSPEEALYVSLSFFF